MDRVVLFLTARVPPVARGVAHIVRLITFVFITPLHSTQGKCFMTRASDRRVRGTLGSGSGE